MRICREVGIDISKGKSTIAVLSVAGEVIEEAFEINHDINGLNLLEEKIKEIPKDDLKMPEVLYGLDAPPYQSGQFESTNRHISKQGK